MPLRDHFHPPLIDQAPWDGLHGAWPGTIAFDLNKRLPPQYVSYPRIHLGAAFEIDVGTREKSELAPYDDNPFTAGGAGVATAVWAPPKPTWVAACDLPDQDEYEVRIFETEYRRLVAAIEIVSPANKDRPESRRAFAGKCMALLQQGVSVSIVDLVTIRRANLYAELLDLLSQSDPSLAPVPPPLYAAACRWRQTDQSSRLETWVDVLEVGKSLPTLPLWLAPDLAVPLNLEATYEETCRGLRIS